MNVIFEGCNVNAVNNRNEIPLYNAIDLRSNIEVNLKSSCSFHFYVYNKTCKYDIVTLLLCPDCRLFEFFK